MSKNDHLSARLVQAEERHVAAEAATQGLDDHLAAVGVQVPSGAVSVPVFYAFQGTASLAIAATTAALRDATDIVAANGGDQADASDLLTALFCAGPEQVGESAWADGVVVAGHLATTDSALLLDPEQRTVTMYRPRESADKALGTWTFTEWPDASGRQTYGATLDEYLASGPYEFCDLMQPGYAAIWREAQKAEEAMFAARKALEAATRPRLTVVAT